MSPLQRVSGFLPGLRRFSCMMHWWDCNSPVHRKRTNRHGPVERQRRCQMHNRTSCGIVLLCVLAACGEDSSGPSLSLTGAYSSTIFRVTPPGQPTVDVLAAGGILNIGITSTGATGGNLFIPASVTGGAAFSATMVGTATLSGTTVTFTQTADTFVRALSWTLSSSGLSVSNQVVAGTTYTITLGRL